MSTIELSKAIKYFITIQYGTQKFWAGVVVGNHFNPPLGVLGLKHLTKIYHTNCYIILSSIVLFSVVV